MPPAKKFNLKSKYFYFIIPAIFIIIFVLIAQYRLVSAGTTAPVTTHEFSGTMGDNGWYTSTVDVTLRTSDLESGPKSTTYWLNSDSPTIVNYNTSQNQILNPSFEESDRHGLWPFYWYTIRHWEDNDCSECSVLFWQSSIYSKFDWRSGAVGILGSGNYYYHNRDRSVNIVPGESYTVSVWVQTSELWGAPGAWMEAWAKGSGDESTDLKIGETTKVTGNTNWTLLSHSFIAPFGYNQFYVKLVLEDSGFMGVAFWDGVSMYGGTNFFTSFLVVENGIHNLYYYSMDNNNNVENVKETQLKIDTIAPQGWADFAVEDGSSDHRFIGIIHVQDVTSGLDVSETYYAYYTNHQDEEWDHNGDGETDWYPVASVNRIPSGQAAPDGITEEVEIRTPEIDFGDSATIMKFQLQARDMAGNISNSPVLTIAGAWSKSVGQGDIYIKNGIEVSAMPPSGEYNADAIVSVGNSVLNLFTSSRDYYVKEYSHIYSGALLSFFPDYNGIVQSASSLPGGKLPEADGKYYYSGNYIIDQNSIAPGFVSGLIRSVIVIDGNLLIKKEFDINTDSKVVFLVTGDIQVEGLIEKISGFFFAGGNLNTNIDSKGKKQLTIKGGMIAANKIILGRDLGRKGTPTNMDTPAEIMQYESKYIFDDLMGTYLGGSQVRMIWVEQ
ncbi:hypothetical protein A2X44_01520 [candidate division CPR3 bacterium GWF2_35_18]|uniref:Uncharacterized protein n=1 Tax=candidate division CPR3 bacterium GW2011_GWF2_35_18 TaxID=1618350 RepID=A0A0G0BLR7_UNCC3|nr:MAG: hypothetical protein UR67_C0001G0282 [candidate division CPR3 bacterium GW2011_GWF2_35_18]KKP86475.1 MAG: hypothetical protein UR87_C0018G0004 [candidate division CPR3 bacterium GW2011_GWE2_35_7]OGB63582.1 MAG: hypothetical protein A2X44_01520 [candidate division CPR3 bacterium GWF2_35_18]OGB64691.1 MAG: hypothetical protein A2250_04070 [candidate division CPR3 bacterium RIFOXYA2_FULL_35_13]OGB79083.1 MAG: hypothetical protein A2296_00610 [candidate division CPR3 bacterium RIFOXYB2_FULL